MQAHRTYTHKKVGSEQRTPRIFGPLKHLFVGLRKDPGVQQMQQSVLNTSYPLKQH